jgi:lysophospholipase L1-like esterase
MAVLEPESTKPPPRSRLRRRLLAFGIGIGALGIAFVVGNEVAKGKGYGKHLLFDIDTTPRDLLWRHLPDQHFENPDPTWIDINGYGLRDPEEIRVEKPAGTWRVLCLGDSFTYGLQIPFEKTYSRRIEDLLGARAGSGTVEVWNAGTNGYTSCQELAWLEHYGLALDPDVVTVGFVMNDVLPIEPESVPSPAPGRQELLRVPLFEWIIKASLGSAARKREKTEDERWVAEYQGQVELYPSSSPRAQALWDDALACLRELARITREKGVPLVLIVFPSIVQMEAPLPEPEPQALLRALAAEEGLLFVDLLPAFAELGRQALIADVSHPSVLGNEAAAQALARAMLEAGIVPGAD